ncbi:8604_t:CDS:1, partial [Scutellospora calospora]
MDISNGHSKGHFHNRKSKLNDQSSSEEIVDRTRIYNNNLLAKNIPQCKNHSHNHNLDRIRPFISRDLKAILSDTHDQIIEEHVQSVIITYYQQWKSKDEIVQKLLPWLGGSTEKFLDEIFKFIESGLKIDQWDKIVTY